jgi:hypothetical protein
MINLSPERKLRYLSEYMNEYIDEWPRRPKGHPFEKWLDARLTKKAREIQESVKNRGKNACRYCRRHFSDTILETKDHIVALALGGLDRAENRIQCCFDCNQWKDSRTLEGWYKDVRALAKKRKTRKPYNLNEIGNIVGAVEQVLDYAKQNPNKVSIYKPK